ncbi:MAG TPA: hypothetical protein VNV41_09695 [Candidatus Acidoferrales bacterium]|nr:hypothetical protein [Candidatus Acidoferrales bacterium]
MFSSRDRQLERLDQSGLGGTQFIAVRQRKLLEDPLAARRDNELHLAPIGAVARPPDPAVCFETAAQLHGAVVANLEPLGQDSDRRLESGRPALDCQQRLMLLRFNPGGARNDLAEVQEPANLMPEVREGRVINLSWRAPSHPTLPSISYYDITSQVKRKV